MGVGLVSWLGWVGWVGYDDREGGEGWVGGWMEVGIGGDRWVGEEWWRVVRGLNKDGNGSRGKDVHSPFYWMLGCCLAWWTTRCLRRLRSFPGGPGACLWQGRHCRGRFDPRQAPPGKRERMVWAELFGGL